MASVFKKVARTSLIAGIAGATGWLAGQNKELVLPKFAQVHAASYTGSVIAAPATDSAPLPAPNAPRISQIMRFGFPSLSNIRSLNDFVLSYDTKNRIPLWVCEHLTAESVAKNPDVDRAKCDFHEDQSIHQFFRSENRDYKGSGFDRGHLAAAGNHRRTQELCHETFLLSNMAPQVGRGFNRDKWNELEQYCRGLTKSFANVYVCSGPLFLPQRYDDGKLYVHYQVLGQNHVAVPTHFYKVVVSESLSGEVDLECFLLPNAVIPDSTPLSAFYVPLEVIQRASGLLIYDKLNQDKCGKVNGKQLGWF